jgi:hypothetical protein
MRLPPEVGLVAIAGVADVRGIDAYIEEQVSIELRQQRERLALAMPVEQCGNDPGQRAGRPYGACRVVYVFEFYCGHLVSSRAH